MQNEMGTAGAGPGTRWPVTCLLGNSVKSETNLYAFRKFHAPLEIYGGLQTVLIVSVSSRTAHRLLTASSCNAS